MLTCETQGMDEGAKCAACRGLAGGVFGAVGLELFGVKLAVWEEAN